MNNLIQEVCAEIVPTHKAVALRAGDMEKAVNGVKIFLAQKVAAIDQEIVEMQDILDAATRHKWRRSQFQGMLQRLKSQHLYYGKLLAACQAGYTIVPNMDLDVFAIRVKREKPIQSESAERVGYKPHVSLEDEKEQRLSIGEGRYENPAQLIQTSRSVRRNDKNEEVHTTMVRATAYQDLEFPLAVAHPLVMDATAAAMALRIFDRIGVVPRTRRGDPIVLGQITRKEGWSLRTASFLIAWYLDPKTL